MPAILEQPPRTQYPASFEELPVGQEFSTDAVPGHTFRKSSDGRGECETSPRRSQFFHSGARIKPTSWVRPEREAGYDGDDSGEAVQVGGSSSPKVLQSPAGVGGQRTPKAAAVGPKGSGGQSVVDSDI